MSKKIAGPQDFSGQDSGDPAGTPEEEARTSRDGGTAGVNYRYIPDLSNPERRSEVTVLQSSDPRVHTDASCRTRK